MTEFKAFVKKNIPTAALVLYAVFLVALAVRIAAGLSAPFADAYNRTVGAVCRAAFAWVTAIFPFSLAETLLLAALLHARVHLLVNLVRLAIVVIVGSVSTSRASLLTYPKMLS